MKKPVIFFIISFVFAVLNGYFFNYINDTYLHFDVNQNKNPNISKNELNFIAIFVAPFIETLVFQYLPYVVLTKCIKLKNELLCIIVMTFVGGLILNNLYVYYYKHARKYSFILTAIFHVLFNLYGFLFVM